MPKDYDLIKSLKAKLSKYPKWSRHSIDALRLLDHPPWRRSCAYLSISRCEKYDGMEVSRTSGVW